jgi:hypothetical protein
MARFLPRAIEVPVAALLITLFSAPGPLMAQSHVVNPAEIQKQVVASSQVRQQREEAVRQFVSSPDAQKAIRSAGMNPERVKGAVASLNDEELAQVASRAEKAQADFAAGMDQRDMLLILIGIAALILIIVAVH